MNTHTYFCLLGKMLRSVALTEDYFGATEFPQCISNTGSTYHLSRYVVSKYGSVQMCCVHVDTHLYAWCKLLTVLISIIVLFLICILKSSSKLKIL